MTTSQCSTVATAHLDQIALFAQHALEQYGVEYQGTVSLLTHSENSTYVVTTPTGVRYVMRVHRAGYHSKVAITSELAWTAALAASGIEVPIAIPGLDDDSLQVVKCLGQGERYVVLFHWIDGCEPSKTELTTSFRRLGQMTAKLHVHSRQWQRPAWFERPIWTHETMVCESAAWGRWQDAPYLTDAGRMVIAQAVAKIHGELQEYGSAPELFGLIHADLRLTNLLVQGDQTRIIDFDDCGFSWLMHDLAAAMSFFEHDPNLGFWIENWLIGYVSEAEVSKRDVAMIPTFVTQRRIQLLAWMGTHQGVPQADCLGAIWVDQTVALCEQYLKNALLADLSKFAQQLAQ